MAQETVRLGAICGRTSLRGSARSEIVTAGEGVHHRHGRGDHLRRRLAVEPHRHRLMPSAPGPAANAVSSARADRAVQAPAAALANGALAHAFELDSLTRPGAGVHPGATVLPPALAIRPGAGPRRPRIDRRFCRRLRGHGADRPRDRAYQRGARLSRAGQYRPVRRRGRRRSSAAARCEANDQCARHRRIAVLAACSNSPAPTAAWSSGCIWGAPRKAASSPRASRRTASPRRDTVLEGEFGFLQVFCTEWDIAELTNGLGEELVDRPASR